MEKKKIYLIAGEASGDKHGSDLVQQLQKNTPNIEFFGLGGPLMKAAGVQLDYDLTRISALGLSDVLKNYFHYRKIFYQAIDRIKLLKPDVIILVDYPGFNLRLAKKLKNFVPIIYYISPQLWAWGQRRVHILKKFIEQVIVFFPFEKDFYDSHQIKNTYVGNPLCDEVTGSANQDEIDRLRQEIRINQGRVIGLLPGSREKEVKRILPALLQGASLLAEQYPDTQFLIAKSKNISPVVYKSITDPFENKLTIHQIQGRHHDVIKVSDILAVCSGTATLETALHEKPFFLVYKAAWLTYVIGRILIKVPYLGIVNILAKKPLITELIQLKLTAKNVFAEMKSLLTNKEKSDHIIRELKNIRNQLSVGDSTLLASKSIMEFLNSQAKTPASSNNT